jgi:hypothetical protein
LALFIKSGKQSGLAFWPHVNKAGWFFRSGPQYAAGGGNGWGLRQQSHGPAIFGVCVSALADGKIPVWHSGKARAGLFTKSIGQAIIRAAHANSNGCSLGWSGLAHTCQGRPVAWWCRFAQFTQRRCAVAESMADQPNAVVPLPMPLPTIIAVIIAVVHTKLCPASDF